MIPQSALVIAAHPDDEIIGAGLLLVRLVRASVVYVTDGAPRNGQDAAQAGFAGCEDYARARRGEAAAALSLAGIGAERIREIGIADQEATHHLAPLAHRIAAILREEAADWVVTHAYEGGHPDHDATAFAVHAAWQLALRDGQTPPLLVEMGGYHLEDGALVIGEFLPDPAACLLARLEPSPTERALKQRMIDCHATQRAVLAKFPAATENFRAAPRYDFCAPPHPGSLHYERYDWGMTGRRWRDCAAQALDELRLAVPL